MNHQQCWWSFLQNRTWAKLAQHIQVFTEYGPQLCLKGRIFYNVTGGRFHSSVCNLWQHCSASTWLRAWQHSNTPRHTFALLCPNTPAHLTHRSKKQRYLFLKGMFTHISPRKGAQQLVLFPRISLGSYKIKDNLQLAAGQETPLKEFSAGCPDAEFADGLSALLLGLGGQGLLQREPDSLEKEKQPFQAAVPAPEEKGRKLSFVFLLELQDVSQCSRAFISQWQNNFYSLLNNSPPDN